jgi:putative endonuclease
MVERKDKQVVGRIGESATAQYLIGIGFQILDRNWRIKGGEIDLIAKSPNGKVHFVEVKTRSSWTFGHPLEAIDREKAHRMQKLALAWMVTNNHFGGEYQVDVSAVTLNSAMRPTIDYRAGVL